MVTTRAMARAAAGFRGRSLSQSETYSRACAFGNMGSTKKLQVAKKTVMTKPAQIQGQQKAATRELLDKEYNRAQTTRKLQPNRAHQLPQKRQQQQQQEPQRESIPLQHPMQSNVRHCIKMTVLFHGIATESVTTTIPTSYIDSITNNFHIGNDIIKVTINRMRDISGNGPRRRFSTGSTTTNLRESGVGHSMGTDSRTANLFADQLRRSPRAFVPRKFPRYFTVKK